MRLTVATTIVVILLGSCTASRVGPNEVIDISGTVRRQVGASVAGAPLALFREGDVGDVLLTVASIGFSCLQGTQAPAICHNARMTSTGPDGTFTYVLKGRDTRSTFGFSAVLSVTTELPAKSDEVTGSSTTYRFHVQTKQLQLPIRLWEPAIGARTGSYGARATFPALPAGLMPRELRAPIRYTIDFTRGNEIVWELANVRSVTTFDPRLLEDSTGTMRVTAWASGLHVSDRLGDEVAFALRSGARAYESPLGPPASRGKDCSVVDGRGTLHRLSPCGLTDGDFARAFSPSICTDGSRCVEPSHEAAIIDLGRAAPLDLIVVRGCDAPCRVDTSVDLRSWRSAGVAQSDRAAFSLAPRPARYVRVSSASVDALTEVSAWSGMPRLPDASLLVSPATFRGRTASGAPAPGSAKPAGRSLWWVIIAAALIGALIIGATVSSIARRRRVVP